MAIIAAGSALHHEDSVADHEAADGLLLDRGCERGAGQGERAADRQRLASVSPFLDVEIEDGQSVIFVCHLRVYPRLTRDS
jgi:hypothetical protein